MLWFKGHPKAQEIKLWALIAAVSLAGTGAFSACAGAKGFSVWLIIGHIISLGMWMFGYYKVDTLIDAVFANVDTIIDEVFANKETDDLPA